MAAPAVLAKLEHAMSNAASITSYVGGEEFHIAHCENAWDLLLRGRFGLHLQAKPACSKSLLGKRF